MTADVAEQSFPPQSDTAQRWFANAAWVAMTIALGCYLAIYSRNVPYMEDWELVPVLSGNRSWSFGWLADQIVEHRFILAKIVLFPLWRMTYDARSGMVVSSAMLAALALAFVVIARRLRGRASYADAFFPLLLLHWGHCETLIFFLQVCYVLPVVQYGVAVMVIATGAWTRSTAALVALGVSVALLPLDGGIGLLLAPALAVWLAVAALARVRRREARGWIEPAVLVGSAVVAAVYAAAYLYHYARPLSPVYVPRTFSGTMRTGLELLTTTFGPGASKYYPASGYLVALLFLASAAVLAYVVAVRGGERLRASGLFAALVAVGIEAFGIAWGRTVLGVGAGFPQRYALLVAPAALVVFLSIVVYWRLLPGELVEHVMFACSCLVLLPNAQFGIDYAALRNGPADALSADVRAGVPVGVLGQRYAPLIYPNADALAARLDMLRAQGSGPYKGVTVEPISAPCVERPLAMTLVTSHDVLVSDETFICTGSDPYLVYDLPAPVTACGVRIRYKIEAGEGRSRMQVYWARSGESEFGENARTMGIYVDPINGEQETTFWIYGSFDKLRIDPDTRPCRIQIMGVTLLDMDSNR